MQQHQEEHLSELSQSQQAQGQGSDINQEQLLGVNSNKEDNNQQQKGLSRKQRKKIMKKEKWQKQKLIRRKQKRQKQKQKKKIKKALLNEEKPQQVVMANGDKQGNEVMLMKKRKEEYGDKMKEGVKVIIDLQFYDLMTEKQQSSLIKQLGYCHSVNRKQQKPFHYILTNASKQRQTVFATRYNADKWGINMQEQSLLQLYQLDKLVYLTGDAEEQIEQFQPEQLQIKDSKVYIIGGIVDHNRLKKITYNYAIEHKIAARRLPMKNVHLKASVHLAVNHVWQWMLKKYNGSTWDQSLKSVIPLRKLQIQPVE